MKIYLCGPINGKTDAECNEWREVAEYLHDDCLNPMRRDYRGKEASSVNEIVEQDMDDINKSDALLVWFESPSVGTSMEVFYAKHCLGMPIAVVNSTGARLSPWLVYFSDHQADTIKDAIEWLRSNH